MALNVLVVDDSSVMRSIIVKTYSELLLALTAKGTSPVEMTFS